MTDEVVRLEFERGGVLSARLLRGAAPVTSERILGALPLEAMAYHSRWSGREVNFPIRLGENAPPRENDTTSVGCGDLIYWREWEKGTDGAEALAFYYGAEVTRDHRGTLPVNVFARIPESQWGLAEQIGVRIWRTGGERVRVLRGAARRTAADEDDRV